MRVRGRMILGKGEKAVKYRMIKQSDILKCPFAILMPEHYREDGSCKCDDPEERKKMIAEWGYKTKDFKGIPLRG